MLFAVLLTLRPLSLLAVPVPMLDLDRLLDDSGVIATGEVVYLNAGPTSQVTVGGKRLAGHHMIGLIRVEQVLKGAPSLTQIPFAYLLPTTFLGWRSVGLHQFAIFLLTSGAGARYRFTSPYYPFVPAARGAPAPGSDAVQACRLCSWRDRIGDRCQRYRKAVGDSHALL